MKIKKEKHTQLQWSNLTKKHLFFVLIVVSFFIGFGSRLLLTPPSKSEVTCGAETIERMGMGTFFTEENYLFRNGLTQSNEQAHSGKYSSKLDRESPFGIAFTLKDVKWGERYVFSIWRYGKMGALSTQLSWGGVVTKTTPHEVQKNGWERLQMQIIVPDSISKGTIKVYCNYAGDVDEPVYFDDFKMIKHSVDSEVIDPGNEDFVRSGSPLQKVNIDQLSVRPYLETTTPDSTQLGIISLFIYPVEFLGVGENRKTMSQTMSEPAVVEPFSTYKGDARPVKIWLKGSGKYVFYKIQGTEQVFSEKIIPWGYPEANSPRQKLLSSHTLTDNSLYNIQNGLLRFNEGIFEIKNDLIIPDSVTVLFPEGCTLRFSNGARFVSWGNVEISGSAENPVLIESPDSSAGGFTVLECLDTCRLNHVIFRGFNTLKYDGWNLTGAVSFYQCTVIVQNARFESNVCEDALNFVRCSFQLTDSEINHTFADGLDCDFCEGSISNCSFDKISNDAADFSGSLISVDNCIIRSAGDKGISVGEEATVSVSNCTLSNVTIGIASKDFSKVEVTSVQIRNAKIGFAAYQKKPEYGPGYINVKNWEGENIEQNYLMENGSQIFVDDAKIPQNP